MYLMTNTPNLTCWKTQIPSVLLAQFMISFHFLSAIFIAALPVTSLNLSRVVYKCCCLATNIITETATMITVRRIKHTISVMVLLGLMFLSSMFHGGFSSSEFSSVERYGVSLTCAFYILQFLVLIHLPFFVFNFFGVVLLNVFTARPKLQRSPLFGPFVCFRVVTRGLYPDLVIGNIQHNLQICEKIGLHNYMFEVVTDIPVNLEANHLSREIVVPAEYRTSNGALFKARALQYALESKVNILSPGDWIVHLDEETLLTHEAVIGILNFTGLGEFSFGQGVITYGSGTIVNWITTLADSIRVGIDYGCLRFSLAVLHRPIFSWKGSFIVADAEAEMKISFDHGPEASIAEDCFFACMAFSKGYTFGFVEGDMLEKSTFTLNDFIQQRRRWMRGILLTALSKKIPLQYKAGPILMSFSACTMPFNLLMWALGIFLPLPSSPVLTIACSFIFGTVLYLFILGTLQTFAHQQHGFLKCCLLVVATMLCGIVACILENISSLLVFWTPVKSSIDTFYVVNKEVQSDSIKIM